MAGKTATITEGELQRIAANYDAENAPAPIVIGHPATDAPAYGWVDRLYVDGGKLMATIKDVVAQFAELVKEGRYKKVSISLHLPESTANPKPGEVYLKHVGFLGAAAPAVPGLKPVQFAAHDSSPSVYLSQAAPHAAMSFAEHEELSRLRRELAGQKIEKLIDAGKVLPIFKDEVMQFAASLDDRQTVSFTDTGDVTRRNWFMSYLERQPKFVSFGAMDLGPMPDEARPGTANVPDGYRIDASQAELYHRAKQIAQDKGISFADAVAQAYELY